MKWRSQILGIADYRPGKKKNGTIKLSSNENPCGPSPAAIRAMERHSRDVHLYPPMVSDELNSAIARWRGVESNQVICGNGSDELFSLCVASIISPGTNALVSEHSFSQYEFSTRLFGGNYIRIPMKNYEFDLDAILAAANEHTGIVFLCSPNNPTGRIIPQLRLRDFLGKIPGNIMVVMDQAYREYAESKDFLDAAELLPEFPNLVVTGTFSKLFGLAALRIGYALASPEIIRTLLKTKSPFNNSSIAQQAALAALDDHSFVTQSLANNRESRDYMYRALDDAAVEYFKTEANFICVKSPTGCGAELCAALDSAGITVRDLSSFNMPAYARITLWKPEIMKTIVQVASGSR